MPTYSYDVVIRSRYENSELRRGAGETSDDLTRIERNALKLHETFKKLQETPVFKNLGDTKEIKEALRVQAQIAQSEKAVEQAKRATLATEREQVKLEREKLSLQKQVEAQSKKKPVISKDREMQKALAEIARMNRQAAQAEKELTRIMEREAKAQSQAKAREMRRAADEMIREIDRVNKAEVRQYAPRRASAPDDRRNSAFASFSGNLASDILQKGVQLAKEGAAAWLDYSSKLEQTKIGFTSLLGSADKAGILLKDLQQFAKNTPFEFAGLSEIAQRFVGVNIEASKIIPLMRDVGNIVAATGEASQERFDGVARAITQIIGKTKVTAEEMEQLAERGVPAWDILSKATGKSQAELRKLSEQGKISSDVLIQALQKISRERFADAMEKQSKTFSGAMSNIKDSLLITADTAFKPLYNEISSLAVRFATDISKQGSDFNSIGVSIANYIGEGLGKALPNVIEGAGKLVVSLFSKTFSGDFSGFGFYGVDFIRGYYDSLINTISGKLGYKSIGEEIKPLLDKQAKSVFEAFDKSSKTNAQNDLGKQLDALNTKRQIAEVESLYSQLASIRESAFSLELARNKDNAEKIFDLTQKNYDKEIAETEKFYTAKIKLAESEADIIKLATEQNNKIRSLRTKQQVDQINFEKEQSQKSRRNLLDLLALQEKSLTSFYDKQFFITEKAIEKESATFAVGYDKLSNLFKERESSLSKVIQEEYAARLADASLNSTQIFNLNLEKDLKLADLAEETSRQLLSIEEKRYAKGQQMLETDFARRKEFLNSYVESVQIGIGLLNAENFSINSSEAIQKALTGTDLKSLKDSTLTALQRSRLEIEQNLKNAQLDLENIIKGGDKNAVVIQTQRVQEFSESLRENSENLKNWSDLIDENVFKVNELVDKIKSGNGAIKDFDALGLEALKLRQKREIEAIDAEIASYDKRIEEAKKAANWVDVETFTYARLNSERRKGIVLGQNEAEQNQYLSQTIDGLIDRLNKLRAGDKVAIGQLQNEAQRQILEEQTRLFEDNIILQERLAHVGENSADRYQNAWLTAVLEVRDANIQAVEDQIRAQVRLADSATIHIDQIRAKVLDHLASQKTLNESIADGIINVYEKAATGIEKLLDKAGIGKIPILGDFAKANARSFLTKITTGLLDKFLPSEITDQLKSTGNPLLDENKKQTDYLKKISDAVTGNPITGRIGGGATGSASGGGWFGIFKNLLGMGGGGNGGQTGNLTSNSGILNTLVTPDGKTFSAGGGNTLWGNIKNLFSTNQGGMFAPTTNILTGKQSKLAGIMGGIGSLASMVGGFIGGKAGNVLQMAGTGAQIGAMFGPIGAGIGAAAGALLGLFSGDPKRKADKQQNLPALQKGFTEALAALRALASNKKLLFDDPDGAISQAKELRAQIAAGFSVEFQSKKYKKIAQQQIVQKLAEADVLIKQIEAEAALQRNKRAKMESYAPTFADGGAISNFAAKAFQNNPLGYITGPGTARSDSIWARVSNGEYVLDAQTVKNLGIARLDALRMMKGRDAGRIFRSLALQSVGYADGGAVGNGQLGQSNQISETSRGNITVNTNVYPSESGARVETEIYEDDRLLERKVENIIYRGGQDGKIYRALDNVKKGK